MGHHKSAGAGFALFKKWFSPRAGSASTLRRATRRATAATVAVVALSGCGGVSASECRAAATIQAEAEEAWAASIDVHELAHESGQDHPGVDEQLRTDRVDLIVAVGATRRSCQ